MELIHSASILLCICHLEALYKQGTDLPLVSKIRDTCPHIAYSQGIV